MTVDQVKTQWRWQWCGWTYERMKWSMDVMPCGLSFSIKETQRQKLKNTTWCSSFRCMRTSAVTTPTRRLPWRPTHTSQDPLRSTEVRFKKIPPKTICFFMVVFFFTMEASIPASTHRQWRNCLIRLKALFAREQIFSFCFPVLVVQLIRNLKSTDCGRRRRTRGSSIPHHLPQIRSGWWSWACQQIVKNPQRVSAQHSIFIFPLKKLSPEKFCCQKSRLCLLIDRQTRIFCSQAIIPTIEYDFTQNFTL